MHFFFLGTLQLGPPFRHFALDPGQFEKSDRQNLAKKLLSHIDTKAITTENYQLRDLEENLKNVILEMDGTQQAAQCFH